MTLKKCALMGAFALAVGGLAGCDNQPKSNAAAQPAPYTGESVNVGDYSRSILEFTPQNAPDKTCVAIAGQESGGVTCFTTDTGAPKLPQLRVLSSYTTKVGDFERAVMEFIPKSDVGKLCIAISGQESSGITCFAQNAAPKPPAP